MKSRLTRSDPPRRPDAATSHAPAAHRTCRPTTFGYRQSRPTVRRSAAALTAAWPAQTLGLADLGGEISTRVMQYGVDSLVLRDALTQLLILLRHLRRITGLGSDSPVQPDRPSSQLVRVLFRCCHCLRSDTPRCVPRWWLMKPSHGSSSRHSPMACHVDPRNVPRSPIFLRELRDIILNYFTSVDCAYLDRVTSRDKLG